MTTTTETIELSTRTTSLIDDIRRPFLSFSKELAGLTMTKAQIAPKFMKAFHAWEKETTGTFVAFVRLFDPTVGEDREAYRKHKTYQAADYLRRLEARDDVPTRRTGDAPATPLLGLTRVVATVLDLVGEEQAERLWHLMESELHWSETQIARLRTRVEEERPLARLRPPKGVEPMDYRVLAPAA